MSTLYTEQQLKNLILQCPDENTNYPAPDTMIDADGNRLYAYVTLVMLGDRYIPGAIVLAHTIRRLGSEADLVVMVTPDVTEDGKKILSNFFDKVVLVSEILVPNWRVKSQPNRKYLSYVFTKFHLFDLEYRKVIMIDADAMVLKYPDHLFSLNAPAGSFIEDKDQFISYDRRGNYILPPDGRIKWYQTFCKCCGHGKLIPRELTDRVATNFRNSGIGASIMLLEPRKGEKESIIQDVSQGKMKWLVQDKFIWPEQQYLTLRYSGKWTSVNPRFYGLQGYPHWSVLYSVQYAGDKPWFLDSKADMSVRTQYPDFVLWHKYYAEILDRFPNYRTNSVLDEANQVHKFFSVSLHRQRRLLSRYTFNRTPQEIEQSIKNSLKLERVNAEQLDMYFMDSHQSYQPYRLKPMFDGIEEFKYFEPMHRLAKNFPETDYWNQVLDKLKDHQIDILERKSDRLDMIADFDQDSGQDLDHIMLQYVKCREKCFIITVWPIAIKLTNQIVSELNKNGNVYYVRRIKLNYQGLRNLMFWMYDEFSFHERDTFISKKMEYVNASKNLDNCIDMIIFDNVRDVRISGQGSMFKKYIRNFTIDLLKSPDKNLRGNDILHINDHFYQTVNYSDMLLNQNSRDLLNRQTLDLILDLNGLNRSAHLKFQTYKKFLYSNLSPLEMSKIFVMGGAVLYALGVRALTDIDAVMTRPMNQELEQLMYDNFQNERTRFEFADMGIEGKYWNDRWTQKNKEIFDAFGILTISDLVSNPRHHMYYQGVRMYLLDHEMVRKLYRHRTQDFADFIVMLLHRRELVNPWMSLDEKHRLIINQDMIRELKLNVTMDQIMSGMDHRRIQRINEIIHQKYPPTISQSINQKTIELMIGSDR